MSAILSLLFPPPIPKTQGRIVRGISMSDAPPPKWRGGGSVAYIDREADVQAVLEALRQHQPISRPKLSEIMGISKPRAIIALNALRDTGRAEFSRGCGGHGGAWRVKVR